jgi:toxin-antitoxin system PIN domain toxin
MLVDTNILLYAVDTASPDHEASRAWLEERLNGSRRVGLAWQSLTGFLRIATHPRALEHPLSADEAMELVDAWLAAPAGWIPLPTAAHAEVLGGLIRRHRVTGDLVADARLAALAFEHGLAICSADTDFARFTEIQWINPLVSS